MSNNCCLIVEDQIQTSTYLEGAVKLAFPEMTVVTARSLFEARQWLKTRAESKDFIPLRLALIDLGLTDGSGIEVIRQLSREVPETKSVVVTIFGEDSLLFDALRAGAFGYLLKDESLEQIAGALLKIKENEPPISPSIARRLLAHFRSPQIKLNDRVVLSERQKETLTLLVRGFTVAEAADKMGLKPQTVASYVKVIYQKLHVTNRAEATREAIWRGFT